ncbi:MAG: hydrolase [Tissierellia bacterium]|nr:hydrolase [Tissierellia bacterium]
MKPTREEAMNLLKEYNESERLIQHALQVEAAMIHFAKFWGEEEDAYSVVGLCHDLDYEKYPKQHCVMTRKILEEHHWPSSYIRAIESHGYTVVNEVEPLSKMEKTLFTVDELTGLINATCLMRPSKSVLDLKLKSLKKKFKDRKFAAGCNRDIIKMGCEMLGMDLDQVMEETIKGLQARAEICGLKGNL